MLNLEDINKEWTLFLDRDGVINEEKDKSYILHFGEFKFTPGALAALRALSESFGRILVVTNQRGVGKGLMSESALLEIHRQMQHAVEALGGRIDAIYYNTSLIDSDPLRKPNSGMAGLAKKEFPSISFSRSIMVGNTLSDMQFGRNAGMFTVFLKTTLPLQEFPHPLIDRVFDNLPDFAKALERR
jgi:D-glycero-D-manno-heptose 1,7-bisphosphate phosphatase